MLDKTNKDMDRGKTNRHRIHRSAVRPFFCCGSQLSLNSITGELRYYVNGPMQYTASFMAVNMKIFR